MHRFASLALAASLGACAVGPMPPPPPPAELPPGGGPVNDECGAVALQGLVGRDRSQAPPPRPGQRVYAYGDALTMDFNAMRLNIEYDRNTNRIRRIYCG